MLTTSLVAIVLAFVPGGLLGLVVPAGPYRWAVWAGAPALSLGLTAVAMAWLKVTGLPNSAVAVLIAEFLLAGVAVATTQIISTRPSRTRFSLRRNLLGAPQRPSMVDLVAMAIPAAISVGFGYLLVGRFQFPPGWDAMNHSILARNVLSSGSTTIASACTTGFSHAMVSCTFYPLAADVSWAQVATIAGGHVSTAMSAWAVLVAPLALVMAVYAAVRAFGGRPVVAGCAAIAPALIGPLWESMGTGRVTEEAGPGLAVAVALLAALAMRGPHPIRLGLLAGLAAAGLLMTHTYDILFAGTLAVAFLFTLRGGLPVRTLLSGLGATAVGATVTLAPVGGALLGAHGERGGSRPIALHQYHAMIGYWITDYNRYLLFGYPTPGGILTQQSVPVTHIALMVTLVCLVASPLCLFFSNLRWARPWFVMWVVWTAIGFWTSTSDSAPALFLSSLWYGTRERVRTMILPVYGVLVVAGACAIGLCVVALYELIARRPRDGRRATVPAAVGALLLTASLVVLGTTHAARLPLRNYLAARAAHGPSYPRTFQWLAAHTPAGKVVAYDRNLEFMTWSWADYGVPYLYGIPPAIGRTAAWQDYHQRQQAWLWLVNTPGAVASGCLVDKYGIEFVVVGGPRMPGWGASYSRVRLAASPNVTVAHRDGALTVYRVTAAGRTCEGAS